LSREESESDADYALKQKTLVMLQKYFVQFSKKHYKKLLHQLDLDKEELREMLDEVLKLNPKPASGISSNTNTTNRHYIIPDFILINQDGNLDIQLNSRNAPDLSVNTEYMKLLRTIKDHKSSKNSLVSKKDRDTFKFIKQKIDSAKWFIDAIKQRQQTMY